MKIGIICFTARGAGVCRLLCSRFRESGTECAGYAPRRFWKPEWECEGILPQDKSLSEWTGSMFEQKRAMVFIGAAGIAVRAIAPFVRDKMTDPPVVAADEAGHFCIPLLSGHVGGANELAEQMAGWLQGIPVITTATDVNGVFAVDVFAARSGLCITDREKAKQISAWLLEGGKVGFFCDTECKGAVETDDHRRLGKCIAGHNICRYFTCRHNIWITFRNSERPAAAQAGDAVRETEAVRKTEAAGEMEAAGEKERVRETDAVLEGAVMPSFLRLVPKMVVVGVGCRKGTAPDVLERRVLEALEDEGIDLAAVKALATIDIKAREEAVLQLAGRYGWELRTFTSDELQAVEGVFEESGFVRSAVGVGNVCERSCAARGGSLLIHKRAGEGVTVAAALEPVRTAAFRSVQ